MNPSTSAPPSKAKNDDSRTSALAEKEDPSVSAMHRPRKMNRVPSVAISDGTLSRVTRKPLSRPMVHPARIATTAAGATPIDSAAPEIGQRAEAENRAYRDVDLARRDDQGLAQRHDAQGGRHLQHRRHVGVRDPCAFGLDAEDDDDQQCEHHGARFGTLEKRLRETDPLRHRGDSPLDGLTFAAGQKTDLVVRADVVAQPEGADYLAAVFAHLLEIEKRNPGDLLRRLAAEVEVARDRQVLAQADGLLDGFVPSSIASLSLIH